MANSFVNFFEEKIDRIINTLECESFPNKTTIRKINNSEFSKFGDLSIEDFKKTMSKLKNTYCENDPFPISDVSEAKNYGEIQKLYYDIVCMSLKQAIFPNSEKICIHKTDL